MAFVRGLAGAVKAAEDARPSFGPRLNYKTLKDGEKIIIRFLDDEVITGQFAEWVVTKRLKKSGDNIGTPITQDFLIEPGATNWVEHFGGQQREFGSGNLISPKLTLKTVGIAVVRQEVQDPDRPGRLRVVDKTDVTEENGQKLQTREFILIKQSQGNFWDHFIGMQSRLGTICDRDYEIKRVGKDMKTKYVVAPIDPIDELRDIDFLHSFYGYGSKYDENDPERFMKCPKTLIDWANEHSSEGRAKYWLADGDQSASNGKPQSIVIDAEDDEAQAAPVSGGFGDFSSLLAKHKSKSAASS